ncbi:MULTISPECIES: cobaltochelatase subunit CobN [Roseobacteraceae]|uniref:Cobaltochelatase subunit CobN n=1 Tax=Celeribacter baekdonensis B30 TaxID=1208323 RepID=K2JI23_9RHOB|nr:MULTISPECIES: cobaltochelatase subunit CobN [Roseobacteraceae]EKE74117.1 cobaltochelatase [Celeribacter baekdonensis B30]KAB6716866.1 cobaltochelatase subunit CobN [Roseobacter sp. TSBP12]|tara:strand:- start:2359 stop:6036 length:3678 start_codon:yes stop_codon:yes gene_type:complete
MHLLAATPGSIDDGKDAVDLGQTPADLVVISAADTELALLSEARSTMAAPPAMRLASMLHLRHPMSVDMHLDDCATKSKLVIARVLGGSGYWKYGLEQYAARLYEAGVPFVALPGDDKPDAELAALSTIPTEDYHQLWAYLTEGGAENAVAFLTYARALVDGGDRPGPARPLLRAGLYWPGNGIADLDQIKSQWQEGAPVVPLIFYRALVQGAGLAPINRLVKSLLRQGLNPMPIFVASLKDPISAATLEALFLDAPPDVILNCTAFAVGTPEGGGPDNPLAAPFANQAPVFQVVLAGSSHEAWDEGTTGLSARDIAMNVALPEIDGRILSRAISFKGEAYFDAATECTIATYHADGSRIAFVAELAARWAHLRRADKADRKLALILANYPNKDGRLANGVGLDTPAATVNTLKALSSQGYSVEGVPDDSDALMQAILSGPTNWLTDRSIREGGVRLSLDAYKSAYNSIPYEARQEIEARWGPPEDDPFVGQDGFALSVLRYGNAVVGIQPARGYNIDPTETYHAPDLVPPHNYLAFYFWLRFEFGADALVHMGKHGNLEWLPGKALALSETCYPEVIMGPMPHLYPFIVNDPGEGTQAKRRAQAVILDHLTPPLTRAETYGPLRDLEALVDEYFEAAGVDPRRIASLRKEILSLSSVTGLDHDVGMTGRDEDGDLAKLDAYLCELKEAQIRDGLHIFGTAPEGRLARDLGLALVRVPRGNGTGADASFVRALALDLGLNFDPLDCDMAAPWEGPKPNCLTKVSNSNWRSHGDTVERLELLCATLLDEQADAPGPASALVLAHLRDTVLPTVTACGPAEMSALLTGLDGRFIPPGPSGAPTRGRLDVLPTGRNFFSVDARAVPTQTAWQLGWKSANLLIERHLQDQGDWPRAMLVTAWGTANMRTGGDDIAQALALMGVKPTWDAMSRRVTGFEILPASVLGRPRVDVTLRVSGFFRDAFPQLIALVDSAARAVQALDESDADNPAAARARRGASTARVFGSKPGAYGAGLQAMIDERIWDNRSDLADAYLEWGGYTYGAGQEGVKDRAGFAARLSEVEAIVQNQDNREHDLLDSDDYYQFEGGAAAAVATLQGQDRPIYHNDHSRPERPVIRTLDEEIGRVIRSRVVNPKWIDGVKRHGYKGAFEIAATVDYLFAFSATTHAVKDHHFDHVYGAFIEDNVTRTFIADHNAPALKEIAERLLEAIERGLWQPRSNSARALLEGLA